MSQLLIDRNSDLRRLRDEGYTVEIRGSHLVVHHIPYVNTEGSVEWGSLVSTIHLSGETALRPDTHVISFIGGQPCHKDGRPIQQLIHNEGRNQLDQDLVVDRSFSNKPADGYMDYYEKVSTYAGIICGPAFSIDPNNTPKRFIAIKSGGEETVFCYHDTASSRSGIQMLTRKLAHSRVAVIGIGGTGSYILDFVAKTPIKQIDLYDGDKFYSHNAFRAPGAASLDDLEAQSFKVDYFANVYQKMRRGIIPHRYHLTPDCEGELDGVDFAFVCIDAGDSKRFILDALQRRTIPFVDCGLGIEEVDGKLIGQIRTTTGERSANLHIWEKGAISFSDEEGGNEYGRNIQIAELNALNAAFAVIKWKKIAGFYVDLEQELHSVYPLDGNIIINAYGGESCGEVN